MSKQAMPKKYKFILFIVGLIALIAFQVKIVMPLVYDVIASDLFLKEDDPEAVEASADGRMLGYAFDQCNLYIADEVDSHVSVSYASKPVNAWDIGNTQYVINADIDLLPENGANVTARYVCRIKYTGDEFVPTALSDKDNWSVNGLSGLDDYL